MSSAKKIVGAARCAFESGITRPIEWRQQQLKRLYDMMVEQEDALTDAVYTDLRKAKQETMLMEVIIAKNEALYAMKNVTSWSKPTYPSRSLLQLLDSVYIEKEPLGVVLILGAWNYPLQLTLVPLIAAIAAGNCVVLKPSEISANTAEVLTKLLPKYIDRECFQVYNGGVPETTILLQEKFDHIFYTGSCNVGKIIMTAAAKNLTPVTLELGGKSPTYVDKNSNLKIVARRIMWGKLVNAGQTCIAPDYVLCHEDVQDQLIEELKTTITDMLGMNPKESSDYGRIVSDRNFTRITKIIEEMGKEKLVIGGESDAASRYIAPTLYKSVSASDVVMESEIFGPLLPIVGVSGPDEAVKMINASEKPLAMYIFSNDNMVVNDIVSRVSCGGVTVNDTLMHCSTYNLPFGGVGNSGTGRYHGKYGFDALSHEKPICWRKQNLESALDSRYMPFSSGKMKMNRYLTEDKPGSYCSVM